MQQFDEGVRDCGPVFARVEFLRQSVEGFGMGAEVVDIEDCFGVGEVEACQVGVEACVWRAEVGDAGARADAGSYHYCYGASLAGADVFGEAIEVSAGEDRGWDGFVHWAAFFLAHFESVVSTGGFWFGGSLGLAVGFMFATYGGGYGPKEIDGGGGEV